MIVVADTSPLNYLILIDEVDLLPALFGHVLLPGAALLELQNSKTPVKVRQFAANLPAWLEVRFVASIKDLGLLRLDAGEREAIQLALDLGINTVLMDEMEGRQMAEKFQLEVRGTLGILEQGAKLGKINFREALTKLEQTSFRVSPAVRAAFLIQNP